MAGMAWLGVLGALRLEDKGLDDCCCGEAISLAAGEEDVPGSLCSNCCCFAGT